MDVHVMISDPLKYAPVFIKAGADIYTFHYEAIDNVEKIRELIDEIHALGCKAGISIKPGTPVEELLPYLDSVDMVLIMSVHPGFGGQKFIPESLDKIRKIRQMIDEKGLNIDIQVDGGVKLANAEEIMDAGANILVAGTAVFGGDAAANVKAFKEIFNKKN